MAQRTGYHPGQGPDARFLSGDARKFVEEQIAIVDHLFPKSGRQYTDYNPNQYGEHEARRERRHGALSILGDQEALLEQALENHEVRFSSACALLSEHTHRETGYYDN
ncbi:hypothetical protein KEM54_005429 [Ascosphaera aggregata]|nr:hypothetical protein KEM54_005429 [Ascosphaera aggregata]